MKKELFYTGYDTASGENIYLGDTLKGEFYYPLLIQYDSKDQRHYALSLDHNSRDRYYELKDICNTEGLDIVGNQLFTVRPDLGDTIKITVDNKGKNFPYLSLAIVTEVNPKHIRARSLLENLSIELQFGEFLELRKHSDVADELEVV
ncbi:hypothetical protein [Sphingobacterium hungaricum]|uniref:Uncharacterized protein n=1 Tax=Sphingobacterium hungaricum TaxID=2082723 RepID=A0A928V0W0_9SPHI|nr:hypothetical protein [Sphingobacterium hungaricum]MBE8714452.1 hypothetical protein [Sphingobacterium hungaricum]